jgi:hypothetical protein
MIPKTLPSAVIALARKSRCVQKSPVACPGDTTRITPTMPPGATTGASDWIPELEPTSMTNERFTSSPARPAG